MFKMTNVAMVSALLVSCAVEPVDPVSTQTHEVSVVPMDLCPMLPAALQGQSAHRYEGRTGAFYQTAAYLAPAYPRPGDALSVVLALRKEGSAPTVRMTTDGWATQSDVKGARLCSTENHEVYIVELGRFDHEATVEFAVYATVPSSSGTYWMTNNGENFRFEVRAAPALGWVGDTHLRVAGNYIPADLAPAEQPLGVYTQTHPMGAAKSVALFVQAVGQGAPQRVVMSADVDFAGPHHSNSQWKATIPAELLKNGVPLHYWIRAEGEGGAMRWDSRDGKNYSLTPTRYHVTWAGGFGSYLPSNESYRSGFFNADLSTSTGCVSHGVSLSSYSERAVRVYVPGITDRSYVDKTSLAGAAAIIRTEVYSNLSEEGEPSQWAGMPVEFATQVGNDFVYTFFPFTQFCDGGGFSPYPDGDYKFKLRFSTDAGRNWYWRGSLEGPLGGDDLTLTLNARCSYFNRLDRCLPPR
ncbi:MAG: hypothetical protein JRH20_19675 [Deltaproteobacteria bacterium]|nr:hypothetical protein [Deltaproteobacteria bacterium]